MQLERNEKRLLQQIRNFHRAMDGYTGKGALARYLTSFFKENRQMGSSDRKWVSRLCYNYFRLGNVAAGQSREKRLVLAEFLCEQRSPILALFEPTWLEYSQLSLLEKITFLEGAGFMDRRDLFPFIEERSKDVDAQAFLVSLLQQPDLFIRIRTGHMNFVTGLLQKHDAPFRVIGDQTIALPNGYSLQRFPELKGLVEVQDLSSQRTLAMMKPSPKEYWWDACAASGGKSLLLLDAQPTVNLLVSDVRASMLRNLDERFSLAGIKKYRQKILDLTKDPSSILGDERFDGIILDAPCSGSGTWGRNPEMIGQFDVATIKEFSRLQKSIAVHVAKFLRPGKPLVYITCSIFAKENEEVVDYIVHELGFTPEHQQLLDGYSENADSMFAARLIKN